MKPTSSRLSVGKRKAEDWNRMKANVMKNLLVIGFVVFAFHESSVSAAAGSGSSGKGEQLGAKELGRAGKEISNLQAELNSIIQEHDGKQSDDINQQKLAETIISKLMLDNFTGSGAGLLANPEEGSPLADQELLDDIMVSVPAQAGSGEQELEPYGNEEGLSAGQILGSQLMSSSGNYDPIKFRKFWSKILQTYENALNNKPNSQLPLLPNGSETMKRAAARNIGNYLHQQRNSQGYPRSSFDFGLGKRFPGEPNGIHRLGDTSGAGLVQSMGGFGKRPGSHRYDFGLGKRLASPSYPRYDFGLGKRAPNRIRYDFGLGK